MRNYVHPNHMDMRQYGTGSRRDSRTGKGRYDLISPHATKRLALRLEFGVEKYGERNWEKGQPMDDFFDSAKRHMDNWQLGDTSEDHLAAAYWNLHCMLHFDSVNKEEVYDFIPDWCTCDTVVSKDGVNCGFCDRKLLRASVSHSKPPEVPPKVFVPIPSKDGLGGDTERQTLYDQHAASETAEMIRREDYREAYRNSSYNEALFDEQQGITKSHWDTANEQLTLEGLAKYD